MKSPVKWNFDSCRGGWIERHTVTYNEAVLEFTMLIQGLGASKASLWCEGDEMVAEWERLSQAPAVVIPI